jgi:iron(III) transport system ATP-binding protein
VNELRVAGLTKSYAAQAVLRDLDFAVDEGEFVSVLGPSGSGKTTLLRVIAGFERADAGRVELRGVVVDDATRFVASDHRRIGYVPQDGNLFPHLSVEKNVAFGLPRGQRKGATVNELLEMVGLSGLAQRFPHELSGGQQQRVALARGLAIKPSLVLLDEPFSSLDASLRASVRYDVRRVLREAGTTAILVTHDQDEALSLADRVAIIRDGHISQFDTPARLYASPKSPELAREFGNINFLAGVARAGGVETAMGQLALQGSPGQAAFRDGAKLLVLVRPEQIVLCDEHEGTATAQVTETEFYGHDAIVKVRAEFDSTTVLVVRSSNPTSLPAPDTKIGLAVLGDVVAWAE